MRRPKPTETRNAQSGMPGLLRDTPSSATKTTKYCARSTKPSANCCSFRPSLARLQWIARSKTISCPSRSARKRLRHRQLAWGKRERTPGSEHLANSRDSPVAHPGLRIDQHPFLEMHDPVRLFGRLGVVRDDDNRLTKLTI